MSDLIRSELTVHGFKWAAMELTRHAEINGAVWFQVTTTAGQSIDVYVSAKGRSLRVFKNHDGEMRVTE